MAGLQHPGATTKSQHSQIGKPATLHWAIFFVSEVCLRVLHGIPTGAVPRKHLVYSVARLQSLTDTRARMGKGGLPECVRVGWKLTVSKRPGGGMTMTMENLEEGGGVIPVLA